MVLWSFMMLEQGCCVNLEPILGGDHFREALPSIAVREGGPVRQPVLGERPAGRHRHGPGRIVKAHDQRVGAGPALGR